MTRYADVLDDLRAAYDGGAAARDRRPPVPWKQAERAAFLARLQAEGGRRLLEVGAGTGQDSLFFQQHGLEVVCVDLSAEMVRRCRDKGLTAHQMDFLHLNFPAASFDAAYAFNCLLHVPNADLPAVLTAIRHVVVPGGLFYVGVYGGEGREGPLPDDPHVPPRFFSQRTDEQLLAFARAAFDVVEFRVLTPDTHWRFQSLTLRRPGPG